MNLVSYSILGDILKKVGGSLHSIRRTLAVSIRLEFHMKNVDIKPSYLVLINFHVGWSAKSQMFYRYSSDYLNYVGIPLFPVSKLVKRIMKA